MLFKVSGVIEFSFIWVRRCETNNLVIEELNNNQTNKNQTIVLFRRTESLSRTWRRVCFSWRRRTRQCWVRRRRPCWRNSYWSTSTRLTVLLVASLSGDYGVLSLYCNSTQCSVPSLCTLAGGTSSGFHTGVKQYNSQQNTFLVTCFLPGYLVT